MYNALNFNTGGVFGGGQVNTTICRAQVRNMICPSEDQRNPANGPGTWKNYLASIGGPANIAAWSGPLSPLREDALGYNGLGPSANGRCSLSTISGVTDGTSNTAMFSETLMGTGPPPPIALNDPRSKRGYGYPVALANNLDQGPAGMASAAAFVAACKALPGTSMSKGTGNAPAQGNFWIVGNPGSCLIFSAYNHFMTPNSTHCIASNDGNTEAWGSVMNAMPPSSNHPGGVNVGMADGSVKFVKNTISNQTWWAIGTRSSNEVVSADAY